MPTAPPSRRCSTARPARNAEVERTVADIVGRVRRGGDRALLSFARKFDGLDGAIEVSRAEMRAAAREVPAAVKRAIRLAAGNIRTVARKQIPRSWSVSPVAGLRITQRVTPLDRVGCYVPGGRYPLPSSLLMTVDPRGHGRRARGVRGLSSSGSDGDVRGAGGGGHAAVPGRRRACGRGARLRHRLDPARRQDRRPRQRLRRGGEGAGRRRLRDRLLCRAERDCRRVVERRRRMDRRRSDRAGRARSRRPRHPLHSVAAPGTRRRRPRSPGSCRPPVRPRPR